MKTFLSKHFIPVIFLLTAADRGYSQSDTSKSNNYDALSLKDLLNIKIVSVSKQAEALFDAPLSATVVTREEIQRTGCTSIMEAMRLVPGVIVRQQDNGNYDINIRGMDNTPPNASFDVAATTTLVMIDNRPVYSYLRGGTFWETIPVDLNDVDKIEVVRGPAAALYGPNAVNGVVNIITRHPGKKGLYALINNQQGSNHTFINNGAIGFQSAKWSAIASGNYQNRQRSQTSYFEFNRNTWIDHPDYFIDFTDDTVRNIGERFPDAELAMNKYAGNIFISYDPAEKTKINISAGMQHSMVQKVSAENENTPLSTSSSDTKYADIRTTLRDFSAQLSYNGGKQNIDFDPGNEYDFQTIDANLEYSYSRNHFSLKPAISYRKAIYDDTKYSDVVDRAGIFNSRGVITTQSTSLRGEYKAFDNKLRLITGLAASKFNYPDETYFSYEFAATYKPNKNNVFRAVYSSSPRSSNVFDTYADQAIALFPLSATSWYEMALLGNKNLKLLTADMTEIGFRSNILSNLNIDVELFDIRAKNFNIPVFDKPVMEFDGPGADTVYETPVVATNLPVKFDQHGVTVSLSYSGNKIQVKSFITVQGTVVRDYSPFHNTPDAEVANASQNNIYSGIGTKQINRSTPTAFGGGYINFILNPKVNINLNAYYYSSQTYYHLSNVLFNDGVRGIDHIDSKLLLNVSTSYKAAKGLNIFCTVKNILNDKSREFFKSDAVPCTVLAGLNYEF